MPASAIFEDPASKALEYMELLGKISDFSETEHLDLRQKNKFESNFTFFENSSAKLVLLKVLVSPGELIVEMSENVRFGIIYKKNVEDSLSDSHYERKPTEGPIKLKYKFKGVLLSFTVWIALFRPDNEDPFSVSAKVSFTTEKESEEKESFVVTDLSDASSGIVLMLMELFLGSVLTIIGLILIFQNAKKKRTLRADIEPHQVVNNYFKKKDEQSNQNKWDQKKSVHPRNDQESVLVHINSTKKEDNKTNIKTDSNLHHLTSMENNFFGSSENYLLK